MRKTILPVAAIFAALFVNCTFANEEVIVDPQHTWDLTDLYPSVEAWDQARKEVLAE